MDPLAEKAPNWTNYRYGFNNPISFVDPDGMYEGDYYNLNGTHMGNDGINDDKVYIASTVTKDQKGVVTSATDSKELGVTHTEFRKQASTIYGESSAYKSNRMTEGLEKEMFAIASVHQINSLAFGATSDKAKQYLAMSPNEINLNIFKKTANAAVINALIGGFDYSFSATMWDGREQALFYKSDDRGTTGKFEIHMNTMGWNISESHYKTWKSNIGNTFHAPQQKTAPANFKSYQNKGLMRLQSTTVYGETIFWKIK